MGPADVDEFENLLPPLRRRLLRGGDSLLLDRLRQELQEAVPLCQKDIGRIGDLGHGVGVGVPRGVQGGVDLLRVVVETLFL